MKVTKRKVRTDFDRRREYSVDVSNCTEDEKKKVQQAFFNVGIAWQIGGNIYKFLDAAQYSNRCEAEGVQYHLLYDLTTHGCNMTAQEFLELVYEPKQQGHVHAELMAQYAEDAKTHAEPWKLWECKARNSKWVPAGPYIHWLPYVEFRRKSKTHFVHGVEIPDLRVVPEHGDSYYLVDPTALELTTLYRFTGTDIDKIWVGRGLTYQAAEEGKQAAILHAKAMLGIA